ncbi:helix-turn-helix domain-containing protein [uncultured Caulobacter sp.]|uniref:helix-turn-helix domain-containing protein n=1 Tax=uncultured Caulobacter sp. TaxID=158749 RepID=UPI002604E191|nr:helix-turn-helix domain-containing protein [uncultured Caulobacter sp.]
MTGGWFHFGWRTALLGAAILQCLALAIALAREVRNRTANRFLAATLIVIAGVLTPYAIGFAGAYDRFRWLTFAPFSLPLALGPVLYGYAYALASGAPPPRLRWHLAPPLAQASYFLFCFALPEPVKWSWYVGGHRAWVSPVLTGLGLVSLAAYALAIGRLLRRRRRRLAEQRSDDDAHSAVWLSRVLLAVLSGLVVECWFWVWSTLVGGISFFQETGMYLALALVGVYLGVAGWRQAALPAPLAATEPADTEAEVGQAPDWAAIGADIAARTRQAGWWREPDLSLPGLARRLGANSGRVSRAINLGLGVNFSTFVNGLRAEAVADALRAGSKQDLLDLAMDMGFSSKASFNRAFRARFGAPPSDYRRRVSDPAFSADGPELRREAG